MLWWLRLRAGWSADPRGLTDSFRWGIGTQFGRKAAVTVDLAFVTAVADDLAPDRAAVLSMSLNGGLVPRY